MSEAYDHGPLQTYELIWKTGHIETVQGHQVQFDSGGMAFSSMLGSSLGIATRADLPPKFRIHGEIDGHWRLVIAAPEEDLVSVRNVTGREQPAAPKADL